MRNGLYSIHMSLLDTPGKGSGVFVLHDGKMLGGNGLVWLAGEYTFDGNGRWKGELITEPHVLVRNPAVVFGRTVSIGFSGTYTRDSAETLATGFVGKRSVAFRSTMRWLAES